MSDVVKISHTAECLVGCGAIFPCMGDPFTTSNSACLPF